MSQVLPSPEPRLKELVLGVKTSAILLAVVGFGLYLLSGVHIGDKED